MKKFLTTNLLLIFYFLVVAGVLADSTVKQPTTFISGSSLTIQSGVQVTFAPGSLVDFTGATVTGLSGGGGGGGGTVNTITGDNGANFGLSLLVGGSAENVTLSFGGTLNWAKLNKAGSRLSDLQNRAITDTTGNLPTSRLDSGTGASATTWWNGTGHWTAPIPTTSALLKGNGAGAAVSAALNVDYSIADETLVGDTGIIGAHALWPSGKTVYRQNAAMTADRYTNLPLSTTFAPGTIVTFIDTLTTGSYGRNFFPTDPDAFADGSLSVRPFLGAGTAQFESDGAGTWRQIYTNQIITEMSDGTDITKRAFFDLTNVPTGTTRQIKVAPNADSNTIVPGEGEEGQFVSGIDTNGELIFASPAGVGTVTSVGLTAPSALFDTPVTNTPVTSSGVLGLVLKDEAANTFFANGTGSVAKPTFIDAPTALASLGASTVGGNIFAATNPSAISYLKVAADNTVSFRTATQLKTDLSLTPGTDIVAYDGDLGTPTDGDLTGASIVFPSDPTVSPTDTGGWKEYWVTTTDFTTTSTTLVDIDGLVTGTLSTSTKYEFEVVLELVNDADTAGMKLGIHGGGSGSAAAVSAVVLGNSNSAGNAGGAAINTIDASGAALVNYSGGHGVVRVAGFFTTRSSSPTVSIQILKVTSGTATVKVGSVLRIRKAHT